MTNARGVSLLSFELLDHDSSRTTNEEPDSFACSLVLVRWERRVLFGFHYVREQWELPGGTIEASESAHETAIRELAEETGIRADGVSLVARAVFMFGDQGSLYRAAVYAAVVASTPNPVASDELRSFRWWDPDDEPWEGMDELDAEVVRRCGAHE